MGKIVEIRRTIEAKLHQTNQIMNQVTSETITIKQEPIGRLRDREQTREDRHQLKPKGTCIRCGESWSKAHMEKCSAKTKTCNICKKEGHLAKACKSPKAQQKGYRKTHIRTVEEDKSGDSEDEEDSDESMTENSVDCEEEDESSESESSEEDVKPKKKNIKTKRKSARTARRKSIE